MENEENNSESDDPTEKYAVISLIVKSRTDGKEWFEVIADFITEDCQGTALLSEDEEGYVPCTCGLESMSGSGGTLEKCFEYLTTVGMGLQPIDLAKIILFLQKPLEADYVTPEERNKVIEWAKHEVEFEAYFENKEWENEDEEDGDEE